MKRVDNNVDNIIILGNTYSGRTPSGLALVRVYGGLEFLITVQPSGRQRSVV
jgi:hypothetical protein